MEELTGNAFYSFLFVGIGISLLFLEVFIPSGGILGALAFFSAAFGIYGLFKQDRPWLAFSTIGGTLILGVIGLKFGLKRLSFSGSLTPEMSTSVDTRFDETLTGKEGLTHTVLRPAGVATIDGQRIDVVAQGNFIEPNVRVRVIDISGNRVLVKEVSPGAKDAPQSDSVNS
jgi:membrane-bound serine protease (ClpP class)